MPLVTGGGATSITGASIVDGSIGTADLTATEQRSYSETDCLTLMVKPNYDFTSASSLTLVDNTTQYLHQFIVSVPITVNKITLRCTSVVAAGTADFSLYSEDGQTRLATGTTASVSVTGDVTITLGAALRLAAGAYWLGVNMNSTASLQFANVLPLNEADIDGVTGKPVLLGSITITADTPVTSFTPSSLTYAGSAGFICRLDN